MKDGKIASPQYRAKKLSLLKTIRADYRNGLTKAEIAEYIKTITEWASGFNADENIPEERMRQLGELKIMLKSLDTALKTQEDTMSYSDIEKLVLQIYRPMNYQLQQAEAGSMNVINDVRSMVKPAKTLIWLDCQQEDTESDPYDFLSEEEREYLEAHNAVIPDFAQHLEYARYEKIYKLTQAEQVILVKSQYDGTARLGEHSVVAEANHLSEKRLTKVNPEGLFSLKKVQKEKYHYYIVEIEILIFIMK